MEEIRIPFATVAIVVLSLGIFKRYIIKTGEDVMPISRLAGSALIRVHSGLLPLKHSDIEFSDRLGDDPFLP